MVDHTVRFIHEPCMVPGGVFRLTAGSAAPAARWSWTWLGPFWGKPGKLDHTGWQGLMESKAKFLAAQVPLPVGGLSLTWGHASPGTAGCWVELTPEGLGWYLCEDSVLEGQSLGKITQEVIDYECHDGQGMT